MTSLNQNATLYAGTAPYFTVTITDGTDPINLTSLTLVWVMYDERNKVVLTKDTDDGISITDGPNGICKITLTKNDTKGFDGVYGHYIKLTDGDGNPDIVTEGLLTWKQLPPKR